MAKVKGIIYEPQGRALEYALLGLNHYLGCAHGCTYCYVHQRYGRRDIRPRARQNVLGILEEQAPRFANTNKRVLLSFNADPYQPIDRELGLTRDVLSILRDHNIPFQILTKDGLQANRDFDLYRPCDAFAVTLTLLDERWRQCEPNAGLPQQRMHALRVAHECGIETWASLEPVLDVQQSLEIIRQTHEFTDLYKIGKLNYLPSRMNWRKFGMAAIELCRLLDKPYFIKSDLARYLTGFPFENTDNRMADWRKK